MSDLHIAARLEDPIAHSYKKAAEIIGASTAIGAGIVIAIVSAGAGAVTIGVIAKGVSEGAGLIGVGTWLTGMVSDAIGKDEDAGMIAEAAARTWTESKRSARINDLLKCADPTGTQAVCIIAGALNPLAMVFLAISNLQDGLAGGGPGVHAGKKIARGSETVFIESRNAARVDDETQCGGVICKGAQRTYIGGPQVVLEGSEQTYEQSSALYHTLYWTERIGALPGIIADVASGAIIDAVFGIAKSIIGAIGDSDPALKRPADNLKSAIDFFMRLRKFEEDTFGKPGDISIRDTNPKQPRTIGNKLKTGVAIVKVLKNNLQNKPVKLTPRTVYYPP